MGAFTEAPSRADDVRAAARMPAGPVVALPPPEIPVIWLDPLQGAARRLRLSPRCARRAARLRLAASVGVGLMLGAGMSETALAPAASAHDRHENLSSARPDALTPTFAASPALPEGIASEITARAAPGAETPAAEWAGLPAEPEAEPATATLIEQELRGLVANARREDSAPKAEAAPARDPEELLRFGGTSVRRWIVETILRAAAVTEVDPVYMMALADKESSFAPAVKASTSSAEGLFQFIARTWLEIVREYGPRHGLAEEAALIEIRDGNYVVADEAARERVLNLRRDPYIAALMAGELLKRDRALVEQRIGRDLKRSELYFAHFFGAESASRFMALHAEKPKQVAGRVFSAAAKANRALFFTKRGRRLRGLTVAEVYGRIDKMIDTRLGRYAAVADAVAGKPEGAPP